MGPVIIFLSSFQTSKTILYFYIQPSSPSGYLKAVVYNIYYLPLNMRLALDRNKVECLKAQNFLLFQDDSSLDCLCKEKANGATCSKSHVQVKPTLEPADSAYIGEFYRK